MERGHLFLVFEHFTDQSTNSKFLTLTSKAIAGSRAALHF